jgi:predicted nuclease of predicted toxin-antitoxin system
MRLRHANFLTDENIHREVVEFLRHTERCDVIDVKESGLHGTDDLTLLRLAYREQRIVLTHDADFGTLAVATQEPIWGIIYLRPGHIQPGFTIGSLKTLFEQELEPAPPFIIVAKRSGDTVQIRVRAL